MDATRRLASALCLAGLFLPAAANAAGPFGRGGFLGHGDDCVAAEGDCVAGQDGLCGDGCTAGEGCTCGSDCQCGPGCQAHGGRCCGGLCGGGPDGPRRWSEEWYARQGVGGIGAEQEYHAGKMWPPYPRPHKNAQCSSQFHAAHYWPHPYNCWDRAYVRNITATQVANGWTQSTTLCSYHFNPDTNCLNDAGQMHLRWILEQVPPAYRAVYIQAAGTAVADQTRLAEVRNEAARITTVDAPISMRAVMVAGRPATEVDTIRRAEMKTQPNPRIEFHSVGTGSGDGN